MFQVENRWIWEKTLNGKGQIVKTTMAVMMSHTTWAPAETTQQSDAHQSLGNKYTSPIAILKILLPFLWYLWLQRGRDSSSQQLACGAATWIIRIPILKTGIGIFLLLLLISLYIINHSWLPTTQPDQPTTQPPNRPLANLQPGRFDPPVSTAAPALQCDPLQHTWSCASAVNPITMVQENPGKISYKML